MFVSGAAVGSAAAVGLLGLFARSVKGRTVNSSERWCRWCSKPLKCGMFKVLVICSTMRVVTVCTVLHLALC